MPVIKCAVCDDSKTAGRHYGVSCCLGCKSFFRRAVVRKRTYFCERNGNCDVSERSGRQSCRACRLKKCYEIGMCREALHPQRDLFGRKSDQCPSVASSNESSCDTSPSMASDLKYMRTLIEMDRRIREKKLEKLRVQHEAKVLTLATGTARFHQTNQDFYNTDGLRLASMTDMIAVTSEELYAMLEWTTCLKDFQTLPMNVRTRLLRRFSFCHLVLEFCYHTAKSNINDVLLFPNDSCMPRFASTLPIEKQKVVSAERLWRQDKLYNNMTARCIDDVSMPMRKMQLTEEEFVYLKLILLLRNDGAVMFTGEHEMAEEVNQQITAMRDQAAKSLFAYYKSINLNNYEERFGNVLLSVSGILSAVLAVQESYHIMRLFDIVPFDKISQEFLFSSD